MDMGKSVNVLPQQSTAKQKPCAYFLGYTVAYTFKSPLVTLQTFFLLDIWVTVDLEILVKTKGQ